MSPAQKKKAPLKPKAAKPAAKSAAKPAAPKSNDNRTAPKAPAATTLINVIVWLRAKKGKEAPLERELRTLAGASRAEPGCQAFALHPSAAEPGDFFLHEIWSSETVLAAHRKTPHFERWLGLQPAILESRRRFIAE